ncbi:MAG: NUDIX hydrolase [Chloroflexota bacterium]|nr:NUDIX hydrolase [Chloroflexota bacterium]
MKKNSNTMVITAAGGIVWRETETGKKLAIVHRPKYDDWSLPKGKLKKGESWQEAAMREVLEETGCETELDSFAGSISYIVRETPKVILFWNMKATNITEYTANEEVDKVIWLTREEALEKLDYQTEKTLLAQLN